MPTPQVDRYAELCAAWRWQVPARFNIADACSTRWAADRTRFALYWEDEGGATAAYTYWDLDSRANRLANALRAGGVGRGDRVALILPQRPETVVAHLATYKLGAVAVPLSFLFGPDALEYRLADSGAKVAFVDPQSLPNLAPLVARLPTARTGGRRGRRARIVRHALRDPRRGRRAAPRDRGHEADRSGAPGLHERHDGPAQGRADAALVPDRQPAGLHLLARRLPAAGRRVLVAGRLGLDRRPDGRAAAHAALRPADRRLSRPLRSGARVPPDRALSGAQHLPVPDGAQADDEGVPAAARALRRRAAQRDERGRGARHHRVRVDARGTRHHGERDVRPDRDELHRRQLAHAVAGAARLDGATRTRGTASR